MDVGAARDRPNSPAPSAAKVVLKRKGAYGAILGPTERSCRGRTSQSLRGTGQLTGSSAGELGPGVARERRGRRPITLGRRGRRGLGTARDERSPGSTRRATCARARSNGARRRSARARWWCAMYTSTCRAFRPEHGRSPFFEDLRRFAIVGSAGGRLSLREGERMTSAIRHPLEVDVRDRRGPAGSPGAA